MQITPIQPGDTYTDAAGVAQTYAGPSAHAVVDDAGRVRAIRSTLYLAAQASISAKLYAPFIDDLIANGKAPASARDAHHGYEDPEAPQPWINPARASA